MSCDVFNVAWTSKNNTDMNISYKCRGTCAVCNMLLGEAGVFVRAMLAFFCNSLLSPASVFLSHNLRSVFTQRRELLVPGKGNSAALLSDKFRINCKMGWHSKATLTPRKTKPNPDCLFTCTCCFFLTISSARSCKKPARSPRSESKTTASLCCQPGGYAESVSQTLCSAKCIRMLQGLSECPYLRCIGPSCSVCSIVCICVCVCVWEDGGKGKEREREIARQRDWEWNERAFRNAGWARGF